MVTNALHINSVSSKKKAYKNIVTSLVIEFYVIKKAKLFWNLTRSFL